MDSVIGGWLDDERKEAVFFSPDILVNQLRRESPLIAGSFDRLCGDDLAIMSEVYSHALLAGLRGYLDAHRAEDNFALTCGQLLMNAGQSFTAATSLLRDGFRLQPGMLIRTVIETLAMVLHLQVEPGDLGRVRAGEFSSPKALPAAKKILPPFGGLYGFYSEQFAHLGGLHLQPQPLVAYEERDEAMEANLMFLKLTDWLLYVVTELVFFDHMESHLYWRRIKPGEYAYDPTQKGKDWFDALLGGLNDDEGDAQRGVQ